MYDKGLHLLRVAKRPEEARAVWNQFLSDNPLDALAPEVYRRFHEMALPEGTIVSAVAPGQPAPDEATREKYVASLAPLRTLFGKYPQSPLAADSRLRVARILHFRLDDLEGAIVEYQALVKALPSTSQARTARQTLADLERKHLVLTTPRAFTTDKGWRLHVETRNIARLRFKAYRLNLEEYFRRKHAVERIENVVVGVVEPTKTWEADVDGYRPFRLLGGERDLELDTGEVGAYILTVQDVPPEGAAIDASSAEGPANLGPPLIATTLLVRSDLAFVTKHATRSSLVWAFNERTGKPYAGARVLLSDANGVFVEGKTDAQGLWRHTRDDGSRRPDLRVLAIAASGGDAAKGAHYAVDRAAARDVSSHGYATKVHIATDRPLYRPNQRVSFRAILRKAIGGRYESSAGEKARVSVRNPLGVVLFEEELTAGEFGTVSGSVELTEEPPLGDYAIVVRYRDLDFTGTFKVEEYRKPEFAVSLGTERGTYLPGEEIVGKISAQYLFGAPVVGADVTYRVFEGPFAFDRGRFEEFRWFFQRREKENRNVQGLRFLAEGKGTTDAEGHMDFRFRPPEGHADRTYTVVIEATDLSRITVSGVGRAIVSREGIYVVARSNRRVVRPGDRATIDLRTVDATAAPIDAEGTLVLLRRTRNEGGVDTEEVVREQPFSTSGGRAETSIVFDKPGDYHVVLRTRDRAGTLCEGGVRLRVAGDAPDLRKEARLIAGKAVYRQGENATFYLNSPVAKRHALLTFEGADVIDYRVLEVGEHAQEIVAAMRGEYAPNVHVAIAIPAAGKLYEASDEVIVLQYLEVDVRASKAVAAPGEEVELEVTTTDQGGAPIAAELSLAVVDQSIFELQPDLTESIKPYFWDQRRQRGVTGGSSYSFRYMGTTQVVESAVLDEYLEREEEAAAASSSDRRGRVRLAAPTAPAKPRSSAANRRGGRALDAKGIAGKKRSLGRKSKRASLGTDKAAADEAGFAAPELALDSLGELSDDDADGVVMDRLSRGAFGGIGGGGGGGAAFVAPKIRRRFADTAYWSPSVVTDASGKGSIKLALPDNLTTWRVTSIGATRGTHFGEGGTSFRTSKDLLVRLQTPRFLTRADRTRVVSPVHNYLDEVAKVKLEIEAKGIRVDGFRIGNVTVPAGEARGVEWEIAPPPASDDALTGGLLTVKALTTRESDAIERLIPILPFGKRHGGGDGGELIDDVVYDWDVPRDLVPGAIALEVDVYAHHSDALLDTVLYLRHFPYGCVEQTVNGFLPALALQSALDRLGVPREDLRAMLADLIPKRIVRLLNLQRPSGGWGWWGRQSASSQTEMTALALMALERCRLAGYRVQADRLELARKKALVLAKAEGNRDRLALVLYALSYSRRAPSGLLESLYRHRENLSPYALALSTLAQKAQGNHGVASELADLIRARTRELAATPPTPPVPRRSRRVPHVMATSLPPRHGSSIETNGWALQALEAVDPGGATNARLAAGLLALRRGIHWGTTKSSAAAVNALAAHFGGKAVVADAVVDVVVNGEPVEELALEPGKGAKRRVTVRVPIDKLVRGERNRIELKRRGRGDLAYAIRHECYTAAEKIEEEGTLLRVARRLESFAEPQPIAVRPVAKPRRDPRRDERNVLVGYSAPERIVGNGGRWLSADEPPSSGYRIIAENRRPKSKPRAVSSVAPGEKVRVRLTIRALENLSYIVIEDPIPAGCEVVADSDDRFTGTFERREVRDEKVVFFRSVLPKGTHVITYVLRATFPGSYRALPTAASAMYEPSIVGTSSDAPLEIVDPEKAPEPPPRDLTPDEKLYRAERDYLRLAGADGPSRNLGDLRERYLELHRLGTLGIPYYNLVLARMASIDLALGQWARAIEEIEELHRRHSRLIAGNGDLDIIATAYSKTGEHVQSIAYRRRLFDSLYRRDREVSEMLFSRGQHLPAQTRGLELAASYPDSSRVIADTFELSRRYSTIGVERTVHRRKKVERLHKEAAESLSRFIGYFPTSSYAPQAQYLVITSLESMGEPEYVVEEARKFAERYPDHELLDDALWDALQAEFTRRRYDRVTENAGVLFTQKFRRSDGKKVTSEHADGARYLLAKTHHIRGNLAEAVKLYGQVKARFPDAADALAHLTARELTAPKVASIALEKKPHLEVKFKNLAKAKLKVYRVDLPLLFAVRKDLRSVSSIDLTGIDPVVQLEAKLGGAPYAVHEKAIGLPTRDKGVYLVAAQGGDKEASTIVIRSDLELEVQRLGNKIRVHVMPRGETEVKVSDGRRIVARGKADARGIFEAVVAPGRASVLAERDGHFALYTE